MRRSLGFLVLVPTLLLASACGDSSGPEIADVLGRYSYAANVDGDIFNGTVRITSQTAGSFSGNYSEVGNSYPMSGTIAGSAINFTINGPGITLSHNGTWSSGNVTGTYTATAPGSSVAITGGFTLTRTSTTPALAGPGPLTALARR